MTKPSVSWAVRILLRDHVLVDRWGRAAELVQLIADHEEAWGGPVPLARSYFATLPGQSGSKGRYVSRLATNLVERRVLGCIPGSGSHAARWWVNSDIESWRHVPWSTSRSRAKQEMAARGWGISGTSRGISGQKSWSERCSLVLPGENQPDFSPKKNPTWANASLKVPEMPEVVPEMPERPSSDQHLRNGEVPEISGPPAPSVNVLGTSNEVLNSLSSEGRKEDALQIPRLSPQQLAAWGEILAAGQWPGMWGAPRADIHKLLSSAGPDDLAAVVAACRVGLPRDPRAAAEHLWAAVAAADARRVRREANRIHPATTGRALATEEGKNLAREMRLRLVSGDGECLDSDLGSDHDRD